MMRRFGLLSGLVLAMMLLMAAGPVVDSMRLEPTAVTLRTGTHRGFGRVLVDVDRGEAARLSRQGDRLVITLPAGAVFAGGAPAPRNVTSLRADGERLEIAIAAGAGVRSVRRGRQLQVDILDTAPANTDVDSGAGAGDAAAQTGTGAKPTALLVALRPGAGALPLPPPALPQPAPRPEAARVAGPPPPMPEPVPVPEPAPVAAPVNPPPDAAGGPQMAGPPALAVGLAAAQGGSVTIPFDASVGAAAFRRGRLGIVVFDQRRPLDLAALRGQPQFGEASIQLLPGGTLLRVPLADGMDPVLARSPQGWQLALHPGPAAPPEPAEPLHARIDAGRLVFAAAAPGEVITMADPETGATLLVGTMRRAGAAVPATRHMATFTLSRTALGLVVEPLSDQIALRALADGFVLSGGPDGLPVGEETQAGDRMAQAVPSGHGFGLGGKSVDDLRRQQQRRLQDAASAPPLARGPKRRALARTLIALGLAPEAQAVLAVAMADDPREPEQAETIGLAAIAALLAGRMEDASGLDDSRLDDPAQVDVREVRFWRAVRLAMRQEGAAAAAVDFAATAPVPLWYAEPLRARLLPLVAETMVLGGQKEAARALLAQAPAMRSLAYARALLLQADGKDDAALAALDALTNGRDRLVRARAGARAVELRLARGDLAPAAAAAGLENLLFAWRGDARDLALRLRAAELHVQAGNWRPALALLRETEALFPEEKAMLQARLRQSVAQLLQGSAMDRMAPLELVALVDENAELMPVGAAGAEIAERLSERLVALDLPRRAIPLLDKLMTAAPPGTARARFGARLAALRLQEADAAGARAALDASAAEGLADPLAEERAVLAARAQARLGDPTGAVARLAGLDSEAALRARADVLEEAHNWPQATEALRALLAHSLPAEGALNDTQQRLVLRVAAAAAQAADTSALAELREKELPRLKPGPLADLVHLLTADAVQGVADLPRAGRELALARALATEPGRR